MIEFPSPARVERLLPKEAFYKNLRFTSKQRGRFVSDIARIVLRYSLTAETLRLDLEAKIEEILVLGVELRTREYAPVILEIIARHNPHKIVFLLKFEGTTQVVIYYRKLYNSPWVSDLEAALSARGRNLDEIWRGFVEQIIFYGEKPSAEPLNAEALDERLAKRAETEKRNKEIERLEQQINREIQPKKKFNLYTRLQEKKKERENNHGQEEQE